MRVGVVSDIHGDYRRLVEAMENMSPIGMLLHAGDGCNEVARWLRENPRLPVKMVAGNCDTDVYSPYELVIQLGPYRTLLTHGHLYSAKSGLEWLRRRACRVGARLVVYGHTHQPGKITLGGITLFNPGSLTMNRTCSRHSYGILELKEGILEASIHYL